MSDLRELRSLRSYYLSRLPQVDEVAQFCRSDEYLAHLDAIAKDPEALVRLTLALLEHIALCPQTSPSLKGCLVGLDDSQVESVWVILHFNRIGNLVGSFQLPVGSPLLPQLRAAIEANLSSRKFKAAKMHRRLQERNMKRFHRITRRANEAVAKFRAEEETKAPYVSEYREREEFGKQLNERARELFDSIYKPLHARLTGRVYTVGQQSFDRDYRGGYHDVLIAFAKQHVLPASMFI